MKKMIVVFNGATYSTDLSSFTLRLAHANPSLVHGVFLSPTLMPVAQYPFPNDLPLAGVVTTEEMLQDQRETMDANIKVFRDDCQRQNIQCTVDEDLNITLEELIDHSAFTDLMLCSSIEEMGGVSLRDVLVNTHCPVVLVPQHASLPMRAILCYDESYSSVLAMKMYSYLFPEWKDLPTAVLTINPKGDDGYLKHEEYLSDWLPQHFTRLEKQVLQGNLQRELVGFIRKGDEPTMVVMGAYGRNAMSRLFHRSLANVVIEETSAILFIMHE